MKLLSFTHDGAARYGLLNDVGVIDLYAELADAYPTLKSLLAAGPQQVVERFQNRSADHKLEDIEFLPVIPDPGKIVCVGLNYENHRLEAGLPVTAHPALFLRTGESQTAHRQPLVKPRESAMFDYEAEIAVVIGRPGRRIAEDAAWAHIAGISCYNDGSVRDWQRHTHQYTAGKNFPRTGSFGPWLLTTDEIDPDTPFTLSCRVNGSVVQHATTDDLLFSIPRLVEYVSTMSPLEPGDVIVTGTPAGVGSRRQPPVWLRTGDTVEVEIDGVGVLTNTVIGD